MHLPGGGERGNSGEMFVRGKGGGEVCLVYLVGLNFTH